MSMSVLISPRLCQNPSDPRAPPIGGHTGGREPSPVAILRSSSNPRSPVRRRLDERLGCCGTYSMAVLTSHSVRAACSASAALAGDLGAPLDDLLKALQWLEILQARITDAGVPEGYVGFTPNCRPSPVPTDCPLRVWMRQLLAGLGPNRPVRLG